MLGVRGRSAEYFVGVNDRIYVTRDVKRMSPSERWNISMLNAISVSYRDYMGADEQVEYKDCPMIKPANPTGEVDDDGDGG